MLARFDEKEERARNRATITIQCAYRCYLARLEAQDRFRSQYRKIFDEETKEYLYQNKKDHNCTPHLPHFFYNIGGFPTPPELNASPNYNPGNENTGRGYALLITNTQYALGEWTPVPFELEADHDHLYNVLTHEYIGRLRSENVISLKNPTCTEVVDAFKQARKLVRNNGFLFIYIAAHIVTVVNKEKKEYKDENAYFAFRDTTWGKALEIMESSIGLKSFSDMINSVKCKTKTICVNYALTPYVPTTSYSAKTMYPPSDFHQRLVDLCNCPVIGSCAIGENLTSYMKYHPGVQWEEEEKKRVRVKTNDNELEEKLNAFSLSKAEQSAKSKKIVPDNPYETVLWEMLLKDYDIAPVKEISKTPKPLKPRPTWKQDEDTSYEIAVELPSEQERRSHSMRVAYWKVKRTFAKPVNLVKELYIHRQKVSMCAPKQHSIVEHGRTLFAKAITSAIRGGACTPNEPVVSLKRFYLFIFQFMKDLEKKMNERFQSTGEETKPDDSEEGVIIAKKFRQSPLLLLPHQKDPTYLEFPICYRIGPPAAPERPFIVLVQDHDVTIEWYNPTFDGIPPSKYKISMKNVTRIFNKWCDVYYPGDITTTKFTIRNLPMGIACQFKVQGWNSGGWGNPSDETMLVTPGEDSLATPDHIRWQRIQQSGVLGVLDAMERSPKSLTEQMVGLRMLSGFMITHNGFKGVKSALRASRWMLQLLRDFTRNPDLIALCFTILGWALHGKTERKVRQLAVEGELDKIVDQRLKTFRQHTGIVASIQWLRNGVFKKYTPAVGENKHEILFPMLKDKEEEILSDEDDEDEEDEEEQSKS